ncbi:MAG: hypothetical protein FJ344_04695 [Sphingomonadales bacterium]|nr:hypothetical protein [Sphingomonadales bacterium]
MTRSFLRACALPTALALAVLALLFQLYAYWQQSRPVFDEQGRLLRLPEFAFPLLDTDGVCRSDLLRNGPVVVVYFGPDCAHCRNLGREVARRQAELTSVNWVFVTRARAGEARVYAEETGLAEHPSIYLCRDEQARFYQYFGEMYIPSVYVFDSDRKFLQSLHQSTDVTDILDVLEGKMIARHKQTK